MKKMERTAMAAFAVMFLAACQSDVTGPMPSKLATIPSQAWTVDPETGTGFVGKGDVQLIYGWNNKGLQDNAASVQFQISTAVVTEVSWICTNSNNENTQERERTTTTSVQGVLSSIARERNQITGFNLTGFSGTPTQSSETDGPPVNSCPSGPWSLTTPAGEPEVISTSGGGLQVSINGADWYTLPAPIVP